jgi:hypothetical protein
MTLFYLTFHVILCYFVCIALLVALLIICNHLSQRGSLQIWMKASADDVGDILIGE